MADTKRPEEPVPTHASGTPGQPVQRKPPPTTRTSQSNDEPPDPNGKRMIADHFRSQGKQPEDVIWEFQGIPLRLRDLD
jgi:hypothetical protein